jgi:predicted phage tail protein
MQSENAISSPHTKAKAVSLLAMNRPGFRQQAVEFKQRISRLRLQICG